MRYYCRLGHRYAAVAWDDDSCSMLQARDKLGSFVMEKTVLLTTCIPICQRCDSTAFEFVDQYQPGMTLSQAVQILIQENETEQGIVRIMPRVDSQRN